MKKLDDVLSKGQWEALIYECPEQVKPLVYRLAIHHGAIERPAAAECPLCGEHRDQRPAA